MSPAIIRVNEQKHKFNLVLIALARATAVLSVFELISEIKLKNGTLIRNSSPYRLRDLME